MHNCYQCNNYDTPYTPMPADSGGMSDCSCYLTIATVPWQHFTGSYYDPERALRTGTMFPELDKPFLGRGVRA